MTSEFFQNKKPNFSRLLKYGFEKQDNGYYYSKTIHGGDFLFKLFINDIGDGKMQLVDNDTNEEYTAIYIKDAVGSFVVGVKSECEELLCDIANKCFDADVFKYDYTKLVVSYIKEKYGVDAEFLWEDTPSNAIFRDSKTRKWFAVLITVEKRKIGIDTDGMTEIINLKQAPENIARLIDGKKYFAGFHMNKKHWYTICLDGRLPIEEIYKCIDISFKAVTKEKHQ